MELRLIVLRHAKSDWKSGASTDHDRPLNRRGRRDAPHVARQLVQCGWQPQWVVSSDAMRTRETFQLMRPEFNPEPSILFLNSLYHGGPRELAYALGDIPDEATFVMAIGHNPGWPDAIHWLCGEWVELRTANAALLHVKAENWPDAVGRAGFWELVDVVRPTEEAVDS